MKLKALVKSSKLDGHLIVVDLETPDDDRHRPYWPQHSFTLPNTRTAARTYVVGREVEITVKAK